MYLRPDNTVCSTQANVSNNTMTGKHTLLSHPYDPLVFLRQGLSRMCGSGVLGGSNLCNSEVQDVILDMMPDVEPEQLEEFMRKFEVWKWRVANLQVDESIELVGTNRESWVTVPADVLTKSLMLSYKPGVDALRRATQQSVLHKKNQGFIFCGGGYRNPGVRREIQEVYEEFKGGADKAGIKMKYIYLSNFDKTWYALPFISSTNPFAEPLLWFLAAYTNSSLLFISALLTRDRVSAVATGAALSVQRVPHPLEVWQGSALGLHVYTHVKRKWVDAPEAQVIVSNVSLESPVVARGTFN